ncbi:MAG TPA: hydroxysqualene dehydroxylase HpnE, partial [Bacteroidota bacterium]|nr:hydroxysqualene dehydroxylase HpnE [Bacteroidota bacterium]
MNADAIIVGGGLSGLAAAVRLASTGRSVVLLEQSPKLGGRCYSYTDEKTGDVVENGQHLLLGAYHDLLEYLELIGTRALLKSERNLLLTFYDPAKGFGEFRLAPLPRPFNALAGMMSYTLLSLQERIGLLKIGRYLHRWDETRESELISKSVQEWLAGFGQSENARNAFWNPIAISVMNDLPDRASALLFARALRAAFLGDSLDSAVLLPTVGQTELYVERAVKFLADRNATVRTGAEVTGMNVQDGVVCGVSLRDGTHLTAQCVIAAVPYYALEKILPETLRNAAAYSRVQHFSSAPIISIHLWFDREFMEEIFVGLIGGNLQWVFNRRKIIREHGKVPGALSCVISGAFDLIDRPKEELVRLAIQEITGMYPSAREANLV